MPDTIRISSTGVRGVRGLVIACLTVMTVIVIAAPNAMPSAVLQVSRLVRRLRSVHLLDSHRYYTSYSYAHYAVMRVLYGYCYSRIYLGEGATALPDPPPVKGLRPSLIG